MTSEVLSPTKPTPGRATGRVPALASPSRGSAARAGTVTADGTVAAGKLAAPSAVIEPAILERAARVIRVLGHPLRLRLLETLETGERNVTDLVLATGASQALVSQHLAILRAEDVVGFRRDGGRIYYRITEPKVRSILDCIRACDLPEIGPDAPRDLLVLTADV